MTSPTPFDEQKNKLLSDRSTFRYWLIWAMLIAALAYGVHRYFEYRNRELDKRIEQLQRPLSQNLHIHHQPFLK